MIANNVKDVYSILAKIRWNLERKKEKEGEENSKRQL